MPDCPRRIGGDKDGEAEGTNRTARRSDSLCKWALQPEGRGGCMRHAGRAATVCATAQACTASGAVQSRAVTARWRWQTSRPARNGAGAQPARRARPWARGAGAAEAGRAAVSHAPTVSGGLVTSARAQCGRRRRRCHRAKSSNIS